MAEVERSTYLEIGGGAKPKGGEWVNVDVLPCADIVHDLNVYPWPFDDQSVDGIYSSHCLEHLQYVHLALNEMARICKIGAPLEIRTPAPHSDLAMVAGHTHVWSPIAAINVDHYFPAEYWSGPRRLKLHGHEYQPSFMLEEFRREMPSFSELTDQQVMKWFPRVCHEVRYFYQCIENEHYRS